MNITEFVKGSNRAELLAMQVPDLVNKRRRRTFKDHLPATHNFRHPGPSIMCNYPTWLGVRRANRPVLHREYILTNAETCATMWVRLRGWNASQWRVTSMEGRFVKVGFHDKTLSRRRWRISWLVRYVPLMESHTALKDAEAVGDRARICAIRRVIGTRGPLPPALPPETIIPQVVERIGW